MTDKLEKCEIVLVLDRSGSMSHCQDGTIKGFNDFIKDQQTEPGEAYVTLVQFDNEYEIVHDHVKLEELPLLTSATFCPRNTTALLDAVGRAVCTTKSRIDNIPEADRPEKVLFAIITDGYENASKEFNRTQVFNLVSEQKEKGWQFVFIGANQDAIQEAASYGISKDAALNYSADNETSQEMFKVFSCSTKAYRSSSYDPQVVGASFFDKSTVESPVQSPSELNPQSNFWTMGMGLPTDKA